jgi:acetyl esterase/lipase
VVGVVCSGAALAGAALVVSPPTTPRLSYYELVAGGSTARFLALAAIGGALGLPALFGDKRRRRWGWTALGVGAACAAINAVFTVPIVVAARALGQPISLTESLFGSAPQAAIVPRVVTFATGDGWRLDADLYQPRPDSPPRPAVIVVHGGAWIGGDKGENVAWNESLANKQNYIVFDIQYRLAPAARWREAVADVQSAVSWVQSHATELNVDPRRVALLGRSAGGHLALLAAYQRADTSTAPAAVVALYAPTDLSQLYGEGQGAGADDVRSALRALLGGPPEAVPDDYRQASPINNVRHDMLPTLLIHGVADELVPSDHSARLADALEEAGARVQLLRLPFARHAFDIVSESPASQLSLGAIVTFVQRTFDAR